MGKPYAYELACLAETYAWSMCAAIDQLTEAIIASSALPLLATGSGGSLTAAHFASSLHQKHMGRISKGATPLEIISSTPNAKELAVLILSAGGRNTDIIGAFKRMVAREPHRLIVICSKTGSPLSQLAKTYRYVDLIEFDLPSGKDGFLATNSLLAFSVIMCRAWAAASLAKKLLPPNLDDLFHPKATLEAFSTDLADRCLPQWRQETLSVLYGPSTHSAALDLESKFTEAALGSVQIADYRNFAHGRHHWMAKRGQSTGVLAFVTNDDREIADKTLRLIPPSIPVTRIDIPYESAKAAIASLVTVFYIVGFAGEARGIDPGRPGVPSFGGKIYHLPAFKSPPRQDKYLSASEIIAIERKTDTSVDLLIDRGELDFWKNAHRSFLSKLRRSSFSAVVFDYDGTLCDGRDRYKGVSNDIAEQMKRLLEAGIFIGVATGRGKSVRDDFRRSIPPSLWARILVGYYNGADIGLLSDDACPDGSTGTCEELNVVAEALRSNTRLAHLSECEYRRKQISVVPRPYASVSAIWEIVEQVVHELNILGVTALRSSHSIDILAPGVSKQTIVCQVKDMLRADMPSPVLCVGDRGQWPGNDFSLLKEPFSLSVDEVSPDPNTCWNLAPAGHRGVQATLDYLYSIHFMDGSFNLTF